MFKKIFISIFCGLFIFSSNVKALNNSNIDYSFRIYKYATQKNITEFKNAINKHGIDIMNINGDTALCHAINNNDPKTYKFLIKEGSKSKKYCIQKVKKSKLRTFEKTLYTYENSYNETLKSGGLLPPVSKVYDDKGLSLSAKTGIALGTVALIGGGVAAASGGGGGGTSNSSSSSNDISPFDCEKNGGTIINGECILFDVKGAAPRNDDIEEHHTSDYNKSTTFLSPIGADYAYARGYTGFVVNRNDDGTLVNDGSELISDKKVKVGILDNGFDIYHPDLIDNIVKDENGAPYGYNFDYGPCRNGDNKNCFGFNITDNTNQTGNIVFYGQNENIEAKDTSTISLQEFNDIFKDYPTDYNWDDLKNNPIAYLPDEKGINKSTNFQSNDHGTHVMGIIGASINNSGIQGVAPNVDMIGINYSQSMYFGDDNVYKLAAETLVKENAKVINMSFGLDFDEKLQHFNQASMIKDKDIANTNIEGIDYFLSMFEILADNNIVTVKSAGNNGNTLEADLLSGIPLSNNFKQGSEHDLTDLFISVVSVNKNNQLASYSQKCGVSKEYCLAAPGGDFDNMIFSTVQNDGNHQKNDGNAAYGYATGTSMAAPVVTGSVALLMGAYPHLSSQQIVEILFKTATDIGDKGIDEIYGNGLLNLNAATSPIGYLTFDFSDVQNQKAYTQSALSLSKSANAKILKALPKKFVAFDEYDRGFEIKTSSLFADTSKQQRHLFKNEFNAFMAKSVQDVKLSDNLSFAFNTSISGNDIYSPYGFLRLNYKNNNHSGFYAFYSDNTISNNGNAYNHTLRNPFISMDNAFGAGFNYKLGKVLFNFDYTSGKNNFFEDEDNSDLYDNKIDAFSAGLKYDFAHNLSVASNMGMLREDGSVLGMSGNNAFDMGKTNTYFAGLKLLYKPINKLSLSASYYRGYTQTLIENSLFDISELVSESIAFNATYNLTPSNIMGIDVYSPLGILKGTADIYLASGRHQTENKVYLNKYQADLRDTKREWNLSMFYDTKIKEDTNFKTRFGVRINPEHQENVKPDYFGMVNFSFSF